MGTVQSTIYSTTASEAMTQLDFSTSFEGTTAKVTISLMQSGTIVKKEIYTLDKDNLISKVLIDAKDMNAEGTITLATNTNSVVFSGVCVWSNVVSFRAVNVAVAYR